MEAWQTKQQQSLPRRLKYVHGLKVAQEFYDHYNGNVIVMVGGIDSYTLWKWLRKNIDPNIKGATVYTAEPKGNQKILLAEKKKVGDQLIFIKPLKSKTQVLKEDGYPIGSKEISKVIRTFQNPNDKNLTSRRAYLTGIKGDGTYQSRLMLAKKWYKFINRQFMKQFILSQIDYFNSLETTEFKYSKDKDGRAVTKEEIIESLNKKLIYVEHIPKDYSHIKIDNTCCYYIKEKALDNYCKEHDLKIYMGLMESEGGSRGKSLKTNGCNLFDTNKPRSLPFRIFSKSDVLALALELEIPISTEYGEIIETGIDENGDKTYTTTLAKRTGCEVCGYGLELEARPHRFDRMQMEDPNQYNFWVNDQGWGEVMEALGVEHGNYVETLKDTIQINLFDKIC